MQFRFLNLAAAASLAAAGSAGLREPRDLAGQPSAKFAANWATTPIVASSCIGEIDGGIWDSPTTGVDLTSFVCKDAAKDSDTPPDAYLMLQAAPLGQIKIPQDKEILINLSAQINLFSLTTATSVKTSGKGKQQEPVEQEFYGNIGATSAMAGVNVRLLAEPQNGDTVVCQPGAVTMASRYVELRNRIGGNVTYEDCYNTDAGLECFTKIADVELESSIGLAMNTTEAHTFQWVCADMDSDTYNIKAEFSLTSAVNDLCDDTAFGDCTALPAADLAASRVVLGSRIVTVQQVRAVKDSLDGPLPLEI